MFTPEKKNFVNSSLFSFLPPPPPLSHYNVKNHSSFYEFHYYRTMFSSGSNDYVCFGIVLQIKVVILLL